MLFVLLVLLLLLALRTMLHFNPVMSMANVAEVNIFGLSEVPRNQAQVVAEKNVGKFGGVLPMCPLSADSNNSELKLLGPNFMLQNDSVRLVPCACAVASIPLPTTYVAVTLHTG